MADLPATHWLVKWPGRPAAVMTADEFLEFADQVKYDGVKYEAEPLQGGAAVARQAHNLKVAGSNPAPASNPSKGLCMWHLWGAPAGQDDLPCPYCLGIKRSAMG